MSLSDWFRRIFSAPREDAEADAVLREEFGPQDEPPDDPRLAEMSLPGLPGSQPGQVVEAEQEELEPPPDEAP